MPKKASTKSDVAETVVENVETVKEEKKSKKSSKVAETPAPVAEEKSKKREKKAEAEPEESKKSSKRSKEETKPVEETSEKKSSKKSKAASPVVEKPVETEEQSEGQDGEQRRKRRQVTRDSVDSDFKSVLDFVSSIVSDVSEKKPLNLRVVKKLQKSITSLHSDTMKVCKVKNHTKRAENPESGFMKPVKISKELSSFTGWNPEELRSRVEVTKYICDYIRQKNLQNAADRRQFVPDDALSKLLSFDAKKDGHVTYPGLQQKLQTHFTKV